MTTLARVNGFLGHERIAFIGVSRNPEDFSRQLFRDMEARGYDMVPVNFGADEIEGNTASARSRTSSHPSRQPW